MLRITTLAVLSLLLLSACDDDDRQVVSIFLEDASPEQQGIIGDALQTATNQEFPVLDRTDSRYEEVYAYLDAHIRALSIHPATQRRDLYNWDVTVIQDDDRRSAFTLPGGHIYVYTGMLRFLQTEAELVGLLAHELYYADSDVAVNELLATKQIGGVRLGDLILGNEPDNLPEIVRLIPELAFSEGDVLNADRRAIATICPMNYRTTGLWNILERSEEADAPVLEWLDIRPTEYETRYDQLADEMATCDPGGLENELAYQMFLNLL